MSDKDTSNSVSRFARIYTNLYICAYAPLFTVALLAARDQLSMAEWTLGFFSGGLAVLVLLDIATTLLAIDRAQGIGREPNEYPRLAVLFDIAGGALLTAAICAASYQANALRVPPALHLGTQGMVSPQGNRADTHEIVASNGQDVIPPSSGLMSNKGSEPTGTVLSVPVSAWLQRLPTLLTALYFFCIALWNIKGSRDELHLITYIVVGLQLLLALLLMVWCGLQLPDYKWSITVTLIYSAAKLVQLYKILNLKAGDSSTPAQNTTT